MGDNCHPEQQRRRRQAKHALLDRDSVIDVTPTDADAVDAPTLDVVLDYDAGGLPPTVSEVCAEYGLNTRDVSPQEPFWQALLVV